MRSYKIRKREYGHLDKLLTRIEAVKEVRQLRHSYPTHTYVNKKTLRDIRKAVTVIARKERDYLSKKYTDSIVAFHMFEYGPNIDESIKDGYILVDDMSIRMQHKIDVEGD